MFTFKLSFNYRCLATIRTPVRDATTTRVRQVGLLGLRDRVLLAWDGA